MTTLITGCRIAGRASAGRVGRSRAGPGSGRSVGHGSIRRGSVGRGSARPGRGNGHRAGRRGVAIKRTGDTLFGLTIDPGTGRTLSVQLDRVP